MLVRGEGVVKETATYIEPAPLDLILEDEHGKRRQEQRAKEACRAHLPRQLPLSGAREDPLHQADNVEGRQDVKKLEDDIVDVLAPVEDICIP